MTFSKPLSAPYDRDAIAPGILHLGVGAFHRAHQAYYVDQVLATHGGNWGIIGVSMRSPAVRDALAPQDYLYTVTTLEEASKTRTIGALKSVLVLPEDVGAVIAAIADPAIRLITLTITERGYYLNEVGALDLDHTDIQADMQQPDRPKTAVGILLAGLARRFAVGRSAPVLISCDNLSHNGRRLHQSLCSFAGACYPHLLDQIRDQVQCPSTMVDSITPAVTDRFKEHIASQGIIDAAPIGREPYAQWVIEHFDGPRPAWEDFGVMMVDDVSPHELAKLRLLNGPHSLLAYFGMLIGHSSIYDAISDPILSSFLEKLLASEILPGLPDLMVGGAPFDLVAHSQDILARFRNEKIVHLLAQIVVDGSVKINQRIVPPMMENIAAGRPIEGLSLGLVGWCRWCVHMVSSGQPISDPLGDEIAVLVTRLQQQDTLSAHSFFMSLKGCLPHDVLASRAIMNGIARADIVCADKAIRTALDGYAGNGY